MWHLYHEANGNRIGQIAAIVYVATNIFCYGSSGLYHVGWWSASVEILLQKVDHCGIAILSTGTFFPATALLLNRSWGLAFFTLIFSTCLWTMYNIMKLRPSALRQVAVVATLLPFLPELSQHMTHFELTGMALTIVLQAIGLVIYLRETPDVAPKIFGYHELFHVFVTLAGVCVYLTNWSIIRRTCNPYDRHPYVHDILAEYLRGDVAAHLRLQERHVA
jgi:hemolysin III